MSAREFYNYMCQDSYKNQFKLLNTPKANSKISIHLENNWNRNYEI